VIPAGEFTSQSSSTDVVAPVEAKSSAPVAESNPSFSFGGDYDDILDVLETPVSAPLPAAEPLPVETEASPPPRAHASRKAPRPAQALQPTTTAQPTTTSDRVAPTSVEPEDQSRRPVTRQQLRDHRNARQFCMLIAFLTACVLGLVSWFGIHLFIKPGLSDWERKMLYAMGTPARLLPPQTGDESEHVLPPNLVKLRGDHIELADRTDTFRDDFFEPEPDDRLANDAEKPRNFGDRRRAIEESRSEEPDQPRRRQNVFAPQQRPPQANKRIEDMAQGFGNDRRNAPQANNAPRQNPAPRQNFAQRQNRQAKRPFERRKVEAMETVGTAGAMIAPSIDGSDAHEERFVGRRKHNGIFIPQPRRNNPRPGNDNWPRNNQPGNNAFEPPSLLDSDIQIAAGLGIDPKAILAMPLDVEPTKVALVENLVFSVGSDNRFTVYDLSDSKQLDDEKLRREVATVCAAAKNEITNRPAAWILYKNGRLEKWEVLDGTLIRLVSLTVSPVFKESHAVIATASNKVAYAHDGMVVISDILEASAKVGFTMRVPVEGEIRALRFSTDDSLLLALVDNRAVRIPVLEGEVESEDVVPGLQEHLDGLETSQVTFSSDLEDVFVCSEGYVASFRIKDGFENGRYWLGLPFALDGVVSWGDQLLAIASESRYATLFSIRQMKGAAQRQD
jgi:hypothetical protein